MQKRSVSGLMMMLALVSACDGGCGDADPDSDGSGGTGATGGSGASGPGSGGTGATGGNEGAAGGAGGGSGGVGGTCDPGTGGEPADLPCLDASEYSTFFTVEDPKLCVLGVYDSSISVGFDATTFFNVVPTWGRHGGPMIVLPGVDPGSARIVQLAAPATGNGTMTATEKVVDGVTIEGSYLGSQVINLPFFNWTLLSFTTDFGTDGGKVVLVDNDLVTKSYDTNGFFAATAVGAPCEPGRLVYTGLTVIGDGTSPADVTAGIYAADSCGTDGVDERLVPNEGRTDCAPPLAVDLWGAASGPVVADAAGHVIAVSTIYDDLTGDPTSEVRGWATKQIARGGGESNGTALLSVPGFGSSLASLPPAANDPGLVAFQSNDENFVPLDVVGQRFSVVSDQLVASGSPATLFKLASAGIAMSMFNDIHGRMWLATNNPTGKASFFLVARK